MKCQKSVLFVLEGNLINSPGVTLVPGCPAPLIRMRYHKLVSPVLMWALAAFGVSYFFLYYPPAYVFEPNAVSASLLALAIGNWLYFFWAAVRANPQAHRSAASIRALVTSGPYALVRHPLYSADIILVWCMFLFYPAMRMLYSSLWVTLVLSYWVLLEERALTDRFGPKYRKYKKEVPMLVPKIFRPRKR